ncbi:MAG: hypothetical protein ACRDUV_11050 [Pseudonocardiaceae bacterium]
MLVRFDLGVAIRHNCSLPIVAQEIDVHEGTLNGQIRALLRLAPWP